MVCSAFADVLKLATKEGIIPSHVNKFFYLLAPFLAVALALISIVLIPFGPEIEVAGVRTQMQLADVNIGVLLLLAISSLSVYSVTFAGWASNNKYALLGGLRSAAQMISYELPLGMALTGPLLVAGTLSLREIVDAQAGTMLGVIPKWMIFALPAPQLLGFVVFLIAAFAGRTASRSISRKRRTNWWRAFIPSTAASSSRRFSWRSTPTRSP
jgi:NADH-quinone oxidoreductase subunit H